MIMASKGSTRPYVVLADIDGDGRGDYGVSDSAGNVAFWRNGGNSDAPEYWQALGTRFTAKGYTANSQDYLGTRFEDVNGDGSCKRNLTSSQFSGQDNTDTDIVF